MIQTSYSGEVDVDLRAELVEVIGSASFTLQGIEAPQLSVRDRGGTGITWLIDDWVIAPLTSLLPVAKRALF